MEFIVFLKMYRKESVSSGIVKKDSFGADLLRELMTRPFSSANKKFLRLGDFFMSLLVEKVEVSLTKLFCILVSAKFQRRLQIQCKKNNGSRTQKISWSANLRLTCSLPCICLHPRLVERAPRSKQAEEMRNKELSIISLGLTHCCTMLRINGPD